MINLSSCLDVPLTAIAFEFNILAKMTVVATVYAGYDTGEYICHCSSQVAVG